MTVYVTNDADTVPIRGEHDPTSRRLTLEAGEPSTRCRTLVGLEERPESASEVQAARARMLTHPQMQALVAGAETWPDPALHRHSDAAHSP